MKILCVATLLVALFVALISSDPVCVPVPGTPTTAPLGTCRGIMPGRVSWSFLPRACNWDGATGRWWDDSHIDRRQIAPSFYRTLISLTGQLTAMNAWRALFDDVNSRVYGESQRGYRPGDGVTIKINLNGMFDSYADNDANGLSPQFLHTVLDSLTRDGRVPQEDIVLYDASRWFIDYMYKMVQRYFPRVRMVDNAGQFGREKVVPDMSSKLIFSNTSVPGYMDTKLPTVVTKARFMIVIDNFRGHVLAGVTLTGKNFFGSIYRPDCECGPAGHWCPASLHEFVTVFDTEGILGRPMSTYTPLVDFLGHPDLAGKAVLFLMDGMMGGVQQDPDPPVRFQMEPFNNSWSCSFFASQDPVALDSVAFDFLRNEPNVPYARMGCVDNYLHEAALVPKPPSGTVYNPTGAKPLTTSLGCHEHWNNVHSKQYSRNLGTGKGIELVMV